MFIKFKAAGTGTNVVEVILPITRIQEITPHNMEENLAVKAIIYLDEEDKVMYSLTSYQDLWKQLPKVAK